MLRRMNLRGINIFALLLCGQTMMFFSVVVWRTDSNEINFDDLARDDHKRQCANFDSTMLYGRFINSIITDYALDMRNRLDDLIAKNVTSRDPMLISVIRDLMDTPSTHDIKVTRPIVETPQSKEIVNILGEMKGGFFVEVGGLDGERSSNTLWLEQKMGWTGLLIEMDPYFYTQLRGKNRKCWSINACISPVDKPIKLHIKESSGGAGVLNTKTRAGLQVPCFTVESLLLALNTTHVDYFSLDVEGFELEVLKTIDFNHIDISTFSVEYVHGRASKEDMRAYMEGNGYQVHEDIHYHNWDMAMFVDDFIFVKK